MRTLIMTVSLGILLFLFIWTLCYASLQVPQKTYSLGLLLGSIGWFIFAPFWIGSGKNNHS